MKEFEEYDRMMASYYQSICDSILPLSVWEFYGEHTALLNDFKIDIDKLKKITTKWDFNKNIKKELVVNKSVVVITDKNLKIVFASHNIKSMNGYTPEEVVGHSPKMFQGKKTDKDTSKAIRAAIDKKQPFEYSLINYKKDKTTYICYIKGFPVYDAQGKLVNYIAFEKAA